LKVSADLDASWLSAERPLCGVSMSMSSQMHFKRSNGALHGVILEYEKGMVVLYGVATSGLLAVGIGEPSALGKVRYYARRALPELARVM